MLDSLSDGLSTSLEPELIDEKIASMSCKAAVKGNMKLSYAEMDELINELLSLDNPYHWSAWQTNDHCDDKAGTGKEI